MSFNTPRYPGPSLALFLVALSSCTSSESGLADASTGESVVPTEASALFAYLQARSYESFDAEPAVHASVGPHGQVRSFFDPILSASLRAGKSEHPVGSATIKELHTEAGLLGWAVMVKNENGTSGDSWYFYEVLSISDGSSPAADGQGVSGCVSCHSAADGFILTNFP